VKKIFTLILALLMGICSAYAEESPAWKTEYDEAAVMAAIEEAIQEAEEKGLKGPFLCAPANGNGIVGLDTDVSAFNGNWQTSGSKTPKGAFKDGDVQKEAGTDRDTVLKAFPVKTVYTVINGQACEVSQETQQLYLNMITLRVVRSWLQAKKRGKEEKRWFTTNLEPRTEGHQLKSVVTFKDETTVDELLRPDGQYYLPKKAKEQKKSGGKPPVETTPAAPTPTPTATSVPTATPVDPGRPPEPTPTPTAQPTAKPTPTNPLIADPVDTGRPPEPAKPTPTAQPTAKPTPTNPLHADPVDPGRPAQPVDSTVAVGSNPLENQGNSAPANTPVPESGSLPPAQDTNPLAVAQDPGRPSSSN